MGSAPVSQIRRRLGVAVGGMSTATREHPISRVRSPRTALQTGQSRPDGYHRSATTAVESDPPAVVSRIAGRVMVDGVQIGGVDVQRYPPVAAVVADGGEQNPGATVCERARTRRVSSCTATTPTPGSVTERGRLPSPTQIAGGRSLVCLLRNRNDGSGPVSFLNRRNPILLPLRLSDRESDWSAAHKHFLRWSRSGTWTCILNAIRGEIRTGSGRRRRRTAAVVDSSSVKASPVAGPRRFDGAKKLDGVKRHVLVDSGGALVAAVVTPADVQARAALPKLLRGPPLVPTIAHVWVDKGYTRLTPLDRKRFTEPALCYASQRLAHRVATRWSCAAHGSPCDQPTDNHV